MSIVRDTIRQRNACGRPFSSWMIAAKSLHSNS
jgi:hypothetical protein